jgi:hypothetical protein
MTGFVIEYNRKTGVARVTSFPHEGGNRDALKRRLELESERVDKNVEIVSLVSDSIETVRRTHSRYFLEEGRGISAVV